MSSAGCEKTASVLDLVPDLNVALEASVGCQHRWSQLLALLRPCDFPPSGVDPQNRDPHQHVSAIPDHRPTAGSPTGACQLPKPLSPEVVPRRRRVSHLCHV